VQARDKKATTITDRINVNIHYYSQIKLQTQVIASASVGTRTPFQVSRDITKKGKSNIWSFQMLLMLSSIHSTAAARI